MKKYVLTLFALIMLAGTSCKETIDTEKEKEAILQVLLDEGKTFAVHDMEGLSALHIQDETALRLQGGENVYQGWNDIKTLFEGYMEYNKENPGLNIKNEKENVITKVFGNTAWTVCDNIWKWDENGKTSGFNNKQLTFLEKVNGDWKISCVAFIPISEVKEHLAISSKYHELNPDDIDNILTDDFIGRNEKSRHTWTKDQHKNYWTKNPIGAPDSIYQQIAQGDWVATRFQRKMNWKGKDVEFEVMQFKLFENGKIAEIWEYGDTKQVE